MISQNEIRNRARAFALEWAEESREDAEAKTFWDGFFNVFGVSRRRVASFEHNVALTGGKQGYVDVLWKGMLLAEHKSRGKDLNKAYTQAKDYFPGLKDAELPRYIIVSDFARIRLYDLEEGTETEFELADLHSRIELFGFISGYEVLKYEDEEEASIKAAQLMAAFHNEIAKTGYAGHDLEVFLVRILFCLFADDTEIFPKRHFKTYVAKRTSEDGSDLGSRLLELFDVLNTPEDKRQTTLDEQLAAFPYVNGAIFKERIASIALDTEARNTLLKCCAFDWSGISASIFGSLFQGVLDESERRQLGAHYTSELNIMKVIEPLFLDELYNEFDAAKKSPKKLEDFHEKLATLKFLDPACGCGNFLVTAYKELRRLELQVLLKKRKQATQTLTAFGAEEFSRIHVTQFYGIEIEEFPALVARTAMYLADHQANQELSKEFGLSYARIPLEEPATIVQANALTTDWAEVIAPDELSYIFGNPPFVGAANKSPEQSKDMQALNPKEKILKLDLVGGWYFKATDYILGTRIKVGFVSTNSISQGEQVPILWNSLKSKEIDIHFAHQTFKWKNDAKGNAAVYCVIVGFAAYKADQKYLYSYESVSGEPAEQEVGNINAYLVDGPEVLIEKRSRPACNVPEMVRGSIPYDNGNLLMPEDEKNNLISECPVISKYIKRYGGGQEMLNEKWRYCLWLVDATPEDLSVCKSVLQRIEETRKFRSASTTKSVNSKKNTPSIFGDIRQPSSDYLMFPRVSSERRDYLPIGYFNVDTIVADSAYAVPNATLYHFGVLTSLMHMTWMRYTCGRLESRYRYSKDIVYNNFPWPSCGREPDKDSKQKIEECAQAVLDARAQFPNASLAELYDPRTMPPALAKAHAALDRAVDKAYGYRDTGLEADRIAFLFDSYALIV